MHIHAQSVGEQSDVMQSEVLQSHLSQTVSLSNRFRASAILLERLSVLGRLGASWTRLGAFWAVSEAPGSVLGRLGGAWERFGPSWRRLGTFWGVLEAPGSVLERFGGAWEFWDVLEAPGSVLGRLGGAWERFGASWSGFVDRCRVFEGPGERESWQGLM